MKADLFKWETLPSAPIFHLPANTDTACGTYHTPERKVLYKPTVKLAMLMWAMFLGFFYYAPFSAFSQSF